MARCVNASHLKIPDLSPRDFGTTIEAERRWMPKASNEHEFSRMKKSPFFRNS